MPGRIVLLYHFFHPDDVVSARLYTELAEGLTEQGWQVDAYPSNRLHKGDATSLSRRESLSKVCIRRVWRPGWCQSSGMGRLLNSCWMLGAWSWRALVTRRSQREVMIVGTDPVLGFLTAIPWKLLRPRAKVAQWCFDLYPEAAVADKLIPEKGVVNRSLCWLSRRAYLCSDLVVNIGSCMANRIQARVPEARQVTITPWALVEPPESVLPDPSIRQSLFGDAGLGLLYSGSFGRAHSYTEFLQLARLLKNDGVGFCFAGRGHRSGELRDAVAEADTNIHFAGFAPEDELASRLTACDLHLVSLTPEWTGTVVPSKFFGALAVGRAVLYAGPEESAIAQWIYEYNVGFVLTPQNVDQTADKLRRLAADPVELGRLRVHCQSVYHHHFSRSKALNHWKVELNRLLES